MAWPTDSEGDVEYPFASRDVYEALVSAIQSMRTMRLVSSNEVEGRVVIKPIASPLSFRRDIVLSVKGTSPGSASIHAEVPPRTTRLFSGPLDSGQDRRNISAIIDATSAELNRRPPVRGGPASADDARIADMKSLLDRGFITQEEYERWSAEIRGGQ